MNATGVLTACLITCKGRGTKSSSFLARIAPAGYIYSLLVPLEDRPFGVEEQEDARPCEGKEKKISDENYKIIKRIRKVKGCQRQPQKPAAT